jgi:hypothetical protein
VLAVYSGATLGSLLELACNDDGLVDLTSELVTVGVAGQTYRIQAGGYLGDSGTLMLAVELNVDQTDTDGDGYRDPAETYLGTGTNDPCGADGWPSNVYEPQPPAAPTNSLDIQDIISSLPRAAT